MKICTVVLTLLFLFGCKVLVGQTTIGTAIKYMVNNQKDIYKTKPKSIRREYKTLTQNLDYIQKRLLSNFNLQSSTVTDVLTVNLFEGCNATYGNIYGVLWWGNEYYEFSVQEVFKIEKKDFCKLSEENKKIITAFQDWNHPLFKYSEYKTSMRWRGNDACKVYLASQYLPNLGNKVKSMGFYY